MIQLLRHHRLLHKLKIEKMFDIQKILGSRHTFYRHPKHEKFDISNEDVLHIIEEAESPEHLELLQVSRSNKSLEVRFNSERAAQHFVDCDFSLNGNRFAFRSNARDG